MFARVSTDFKSELADLLSRLERPMPITRLLLVDFEESNLHWLSAVSQRLNFEVLAAMPFKDGIAHRISRNSIKCGVFLGGYMISPFCPFGARLSHTAARGFFLQPGKINVQHLTLDCGDWLSGKHFSVSTMILPPLATALTNGKTTLVWL